MKKIILTVLSACLILLLAVSFTACKEDPVYTKAPSKFKLDSDTLVLKWSKINDARGYEVKISGEERIRTVKSPTFSLEYLSPGDYVIEVRALNINPEYENSEWVSFEFKREAESGLKYKLINNKTEYEVAGSGTAFGDIVIEDVYRGKPVTQIAAKAFSGNKKVTSIVIGNNVKTIGNNAFAKCSELTSVTIADSVTTIGEYAFQSCKKLTSVNIPNKVISIEPSTFSWCVALKTVTIGNSVVSIADNAFAECAELTSVTLPDSVQTVGEYAFTNCAKLSSVTLGDGIQSVSNYAFFGCAGLASLDLGNSITTIGLGAFRDCSSLTSLTIPDSVMTIQSEAFVNCTSLASIDLGNGLTQLGSFAFYGSIPHQIAHGEVADPTIADSEPKATDVFYLDGWLIEAVDRDLDSFTLKEGTIGVADNAFQSCKKLKSARLTTVKYVGNASFAFCESLEKMYGCSEILIINEYAFYECPKLSNFDRNNALKVQKIGNGAFENCTMLDDHGIQLPAYGTLMYLGGNAFYGTLPFQKATAAQPVVCFDSWVVGFREGGMYMSQVDVPDVNPSDGKTVIEAIGNYAFQNAVFMGGGLWLPNSIKYIGRGAFYDLYMMGGVGGAASLEYIDDYAFYGCSSAYLFAIPDPAERGVVQLPKTLKYIGRSAFYQCTGIIGVKFPASVEYIGPYAFYGCSNLGDSGEVYGSIEDFKNGGPTLKGPVIFAIGAKTKYIGDRAFQGCSGIKEMVLPANLEYLGSRAFYNCTKLEKVVFGDGEKALNVLDYTFYNCENLQTLTISKNITSIGNYAFKGCASLENIVMGNQLQTIGNYAFYGCVKVKTIVFSQSVKSIGNYAFKGCAMVDSVVLPDNIETIGKHAFYGLHSATFFAEPDSIKPYWNDRWNSSYRAIFWGCELSDDKTYVVSYTKNKDLYDNLSAPDATLIPERAEFVFMGWSTDPEATRASHNAAQISELPDGTTVYSVWMEVPAEAE